MDIEDSPLSEAERQKFIEITNLWWNEAEGRHIRIVPYALKKDGRWFACAKLPDDPSKEWSEPLD